MIAAGGASAGAPSFPAAQAVCEAAGGTFGNFEPVYYQCTGVTEAAGFTAGQEVCERVSGGSFAAPVGSDLYACFL